MLCRTAAGYQFGDFTRGIFAKGAGKRSGDAGDGYMFGDFLRGVFTSAADKDVKDSNRVALINHGRQLMLQHRCVAVLAATAQNPQLRTSVIGRGVPEGRVDSMFRSLAGPLFACYLPAIARAWPGARLPASRSRS